MILIVFYLAFPTKLSFMYGGVETVVGLSERPNASTPRGASASTFTAAQRVILIDVFTRFASIMEDAIADERMSGVLSVGFDTMYVPAEPSLY